MFGRSPKVGLTLRKPKAAYLLNGSCGQKAESQMLADASFIR